MTYGYEKIKKMQKKSMTMGEFCAWRHWRKIGENISGKEMSNAILSSLQDRIDRLFVRHRCCDKKMTINVDVALKVVVLRAVDW